MIDLRGVIPPLVTPLDTQGRVDTESTRRLVEHLVRGGVNGLFPLGSTGEGAQLTQQQRQTMLNTVIAANAGRVQVLVGAIASSTATVIEYGHEAAVAGADALIVTAPYYYTYSQSEIIEHFRLVHKAVNLPIIAYNIPSMVKVNLEKSTIQTLAEEGTIVGLKDTSADLSATRGLMIACRNIEGFNILSGLEWVADSALAIGAAGLVPGIGNIAPSDFVAIYDAAQRGDWETAQRHQERMIRLFDICYHGAATSSYSAGALGGFKAALVLQGILEAGTMIAPMKGLNESAYAPIRAVLESLDLLNV